MAESRAEADWGRTSSLLALIANVNRPKGKRAYKPADFDPTNTQHDTQVYTDLSQAKQFFLPGSGDQT